MRLTAKQVTWLKVSLHLAGLLPFLWLVWAINHGGLGADPVKDIQHFTREFCLSRRKCYTVPFPCRCTGDICLPIRLR